MPAPTTTNDFLALVRKSGLIEPAYLDSYLAHVEAENPGLEPRKLAGLFINDGLLSRFQAEQLLLGKWRGFTIGKYKVLERLGSGGMGTVYLCEHVLVHRKVAVKVLPTSKAENPAALGRFYREARAAGVLDHPNLVKAHDIDQDGGLHFLIMEYVDGSSLQAIVSRFGPLALDRACHYVRQAARGLQHAHEAGLVHRDVKPANILLDRGGTIRVLDLGLARFCDPTDELTLKYDDKNILGTADYVSPEQALNSHDVDIRTDIYSLGATFYFCLTGQTLFPGAKAAQKLVWHQMREPTPVRDVRPEVAPELAAIVHKMLAKKPDNRYQTPAEVVDALEPWTRAAIAPPAEQEMPRLSPAAVRVGSDSELGTSSAQRLLQSGGSSSRSRVPSRGPQPANDSNIRGLSQRPPRSGSAAAVETPSRLGADTTTKTDQPRTETPAPPAVAWPGRERLMRGLRVAALVLAGAVIGLSLRWNLVQRHQPPAAPPSAELRIKN